jgi:3-dehydrosphinganine reductase
MPSIESYFKGKHVLITGGSSGIGLAAGRQLVGAGAKVTLLARRADVLEKARAGLGERALAVPLDVADEAQVHERVGAHLAAHPADMLINNAGVVMPGRFLELEARQFREMMDVNYFGTVNMCRVVLPQIVARGGGHVLNVSSMAGVIGVYGYTAYAASKFAIIGFSEALRGEMWPHKVRVSVCCPPDTDTPQLHFENQYKPAETKAIAGNAGLMSADAVATSMLQGMAGGSFQIIPGFTSQAITVAYRYIPGIARWVMDQDQKKAAKA